MKIRIADDVGSSYVHFSLDGFGARAKNLQCRQVLQDHITNKLELLIVLRFVMLVCFGRQYFLDVGYFQLIKQTVIELETPSVGTKLNFIIK